MSSIQESHPKVWVIKEQVRRGETGPEPMDYTPAMKYGDLEFVTTHDIPLYPNSHVREAWEAQVHDWLKRYDEARDYIIITGQPLAIYMVGQRMGEWGLRPRFLVWRREEGRYIPFEPTAGEVQYA